MSQATNKTAPQLAAEPLSASRKRKLARRASRDVIREFLKDAKTMAALPEELRKAIVTHFSVASGGGRASSGTGLFSRLRAAFFALPVGKGMDELEVFKTYKIGRGEMRKRVREFIKNPCADERVWVEFDGASESWIVRSKGANPPANWKGYLPAQK